MEAHIQPALGLGQRIIADADTTLGIQPCNARLGVAIDALVTGDFCIFPLLKRRVRCGRAAINRPRTSTSTSISTQSNLAIHRHASLHQAGIL